MLKRILMTIVLAGSIGGAIAACNNAATPSPSLTAPSAAPSAAVESPSAAPSVEASPSSS